MVTSDHCSIGKNRTCKRIIVLIVLLSNITNCLANIFTGLRRGLR